MNIDFGSSIARAFQKHFESELQKAREKNDGLTLTMEQTNQLRGRIQLLKELIRLPQDREIEIAQSRIEHPD